MISPFAKTNAVNSGYYSQLNVVKTIEQILHIAPMNQEDRAAEPIRDAFTNTPDRKPFTALPNQIPLTFGLGVTTPASNAAVAGTGAAAPTVPAAATALAAQWQIWSSHQNFGGSTATEDASNSAQLNRLDWYTATGWVRAFPGDSTILGPYQVPGWDRPAAEIGG